MWTEPHREVEALLCVEKFFPEPARSRHAVEVEEIHDRLGRIFKVSPKTGEPTDPAASLSSIADTLTVRHGEFMEGCRLISRLRDNYFERLSHTPLNEENFKVFLFRSHMLSILVLFAKRNDVPISKRLRCLGSVADLLNAILSCHYLPQWSRTANESHPFEQPNDLYKRVRDTLSQSLDFEFVYHGLIKRANMSYRRPIASSSTKEKLFASDLVVLADSCRIFWNPSDTANLVLQNGHLDLVLRKTHRIYLHNRLLGLFLHPSMCHKMMKDNTLFDYWAGPSFSQIALSWHATFLNLVSRGMKFAWSHGEPVLDIVLPRLKTITTFLLFGLIKLPLSQTKINVTFYEDKVPNDYSFITDTRSPSALKAVAKIIVYCLQPLDADWEGQPREWDLSTINTSVSIESEPEQPHAAFDILRLIIQSATPYTHPTCTAKCTTSLADWISELVSSYLVRVLRERVACREEVGMDKSTGVSYKLGPREDEVFVDLLLPICIQGMYSKHSNLGTKYESALSSLCALSPVRVCNALVDRVLMIMTSEVQSDQLVPTLRFMIRFLPYLIRYSAGHLPALMEACMPGVDSSDPIKTIQTFTLMLTLLAFVPAMDVSTVDYSDYDWDGFRKAFNQVEGFPCDQQDRQRRLDEWCNVAPVSSIRNFPAERLVDLSDDYKKSVYTDTEMFRNMIMSRVYATESLTNILKIYVDKLIEYISVGQAIEKGSESVSSMVASAVVSIVGSTFALMVASCDQSLYDWIVERVSNWVFSECNPLASKCVQQIVAALMARDTPKTRDLFLKKSFRKVMDGHQLNKDLPKHELLWYMNIILACIRRYDPVNLMTCYRPDLEQLVRVCLYDEEKGTSKIGAKIMRRITECCLGIEPLTKESCPLSPKDCLDPNRVNSFVFKWGLPFWIEYHSGADKEEFDPKNVQGIRLVNNDITWMMPNRECLLMAIEMICSTIMPYCVELERVFRQKQTIVTEDAGEAVTLKIETATWSTFEAFKVELLKLVGKPDTSTREQLELPKEFKKSTLQSFLRLISVLRVTSKSFASLFLSDAPPFTPLQPTLTDLDLPIVPLFNQYVVKFLKDAALQLSGLHLHSEPLTFTFNRETTSHQLTGLEEVKAMRKLLMLVYQVLCPRTAISRQENVHEDIETWRFLMFSMSEKSQSIPLGVMEDMCRSWWVGRIFLGFVKKGESKKQAIPMNEDRWVLLNFIVSQCLHFYAATRKLAQTLCENACLSHKGIRTDIGKFLISKLGEMVEVQGEGDMLDDVLEEKGHIMPAASPSAERSAGALSGDEGRPQTHDSGHAASVSEGNEHSIAEHSLGETAHTWGLRRLTTLDIQKTESMRTGLTFLLTQKPMMRRVASSPDLYGKLMYGLFSTFAHLVERPTVQARLLSLTSLAINQREDLIRCGKEFEVTLVSELVSPILVGLADKALHWRAQFVGLVSLNIALSDTFFTDENKDWIEQIGHQYVKGVKDTKNPPAIVALCACCLTIFLKLTMKHEVAISDKLIDELADVETVQCVVKAVHCIHSQLHSNAESPGKTTAADYIRSLLIDIVKIARYWPVSRVLRRGREFSLHCVLLAHTYIQFLHRVRPDTFWHVLSNGFVPAVKLLSDEPLSEFGSHSGVPEMCSGALRAARLWSVDEIERIWHSLQPVMRTETIKIDLDLIDNWVDGFRYLLHGFTMDSKIRLKSTLPESPSALPDRVDRGTDPMAVDCHLFPHPDAIVIPIVNFIFDSKTPVSVTTVSPFPSFNFQSHIVNEEGAGAGAEDRKIPALVNDSLKLLEYLYILVPDIIWHVPDFDKILLDNLFAALSFPYAQVRDGVSRVLYRLLVTVIESDIVFQKLDVTKHDRVLPAIARIDKFKADLNERFTQLIPLVAQDCLEYSDRVAGHQTPIFLNEVEGISKLIVFSFLSRCGKPLLSISPGFLAMSFECLKHPSPQVKACAWTSSAILCLSETLSMDICALRCVLNELVIAVNSDSWRVRTYAVRIAEMILSKNRAILNHYPNTQSILVNILIQCLDDPQLEVQGIAAVAMSLHAPLLKDQDCGKLVQKFLSISGPARPGADQPKAPLMLKGIFGLSALLGAFPYTIPPWLPPAICTFAQYANDCQSDIVKKRVEKVLQNFFKSHQDAWEYEHKLKFTPEQLEVLEAFKGRPVYFG